MLSCLVWHIYHLHWLKCLSSLASKRVWGRVLTERWQWRWLYVRLHLSLPPNQQGVIPAPAPLNLSNQSLQLSNFNPLGGAWGPISSLIWLGIRRHSNISPAGGETAVSLRKRTNNVMKGRGGYANGDEDDDEVPEIAFTDWAGSLGWNGERIQRKEGKITFSTILSGEFFLLKQDRACWTMFFSWFNLSFLLLLYCCIFMFSFLTINPETIFCTIRRVFPMHVLLSLP